jgi:hypothetical protein
MNQFPKGFPQGRRRNEDFLTTNRKWRMKSKTAGFGEALTGGI